MTVPTVPQTVYQRGYTEAFPGQLGDTGPARVESLQLNQGAALPSGIFVAPSGDQTANLIAASTTPAAGILLNVFAREPGVNAPLSGITTWVDGATAPVLVEGAAWVVSEVAFAVNDPVFVRFAAGAGGTQLGAIRKDADTASARRLKGARIVKASTGAGVALVYFDAAVDFAAMVA
jgi:hypothetical protein